jgi:predicted nucleic acid-binding protein
VVPRVESPIPAVTRDPKDDYLLAYALVGEADYLVTGDEDLLVLEGQISELEILTPRQFSQVLSGYFS